MRLFLSIIMLCLATGQPLYAGYETIILDQLPQYVTVQGINGPENWPNPAAHMMPVGVLCKPEGFARHAVEPEKRTVIVRSEGGTLTNDEVLAVCPTLLDAKYAKLLAAAQAQEAKSISGVGLSILALGVAQQKPKAMACAAWTQTLWAIYYERKGLIAGDLEAEPDVDFGAAGDMPYTVPELSAEAWGSAP